MTQDLLSLVGNPKEEKIVSDIFPFCFKMAINVLAGRRV